MAYGELPKSFGKLSKDETKYFQTYIDQTLQVPTGTSTPAGLAKSSSKIKAAEVTKHNDNVSKIVKTLHLKVVNECPILNRARI